MKQDLKTHLGLFLIGLGVVFIIWFVPGLPAWAWALLGAALFFGLARLLGVTAAAGYGALFLGWALGGLAADVTGLQSLKLVGTGLGLVMWGWLERLSWVAWLGGALAFAGTLVFVWEASLGGWVALILLGLGFYLALRRPERIPQPGEDVADKNEYLSALVRWRNEEARRLGILNTAVVSDEEIGCLSALSQPPGLAELTGCLGGDEERARALWEYLKAER